MTVFVDDMYRHAMGQYRGMRMSHMIADTEAELHAMAARIGIARAWYQGDHYDVAYSRRAQAVRLGAVEVTMRQLAAMSARAKAEGAPGAPEEAVEWLRRRLARRTAERASQGLVPPEGAPGPWLLECPGGEVEPWAFDAGGWYPAGNGRGPRLSPAEIASEGWKIVGRAAA